MQFTSDVNSQLRNFKTQINKFNNKYSIDEHYINATYRFYYPILLKAGDKIAKTSKDTSNCVKTIEDVLFAQLIADDSQVININATKIHSKDIRIEIELELKPLKHIL
jgi:Holliday junction resolvase RusA-like endonuclease